MQGRTKQTRTSMCVVSYSRSATQPVRPLFAFSHSVPTPYWQSESTSTHAFHEMHRIGDVEMTTASSSASCGLLRLGCALNQARPRQPSPKGRCVTYLRRCWRAVLRLCIHAASVRGTLSTSVHERWLRAITQVRPQERLCVPLEPALLVCWPRLGWD